MTLRWLIRRTTSTLIFGGCYLLGAPVFGLSTSSCTAAFSACEVYEDGNLLQLPALTIAGDVVLLDAPSTVSDVFRIFNNIVNTGGGTGVGDQAFLFSADEGNLPIVLSVNAVSMERYKSSAGAIYFTKRADTAGRAARELRSAAAA